MKHLVNKFRSYWVEDFSFVSLLAMLIFTIFIMPTLIELQWAGVLLLNIMFSAIFFVGIWSALSKRWIIGTSLLFGIYVILKVLRFTPSFHLIPYNNVIIENIIASLNIMAFIYINMKLLFRNKEFNFYRVIGAINVYLLIALWGAFMFEIIHLLFDSSIETGEILSGGHEDFSEYIYFSITSITTVGYGDIVPVHPAARMLATFLSATGMLFPAVIIARLVSLVK